MPTPKALTARIFETEGFAVSFTKNGFHLKDSPEELPAYEWTVPAPGAWTISQWLAERFHPLYPGYTARISDAHGRPVYNGQALLSAIRAPE